MLLAHSRCCTCPSLSRARAEVRSGGSAWGAALPGNKLLSSIPVCGELPPSALGEKQAERRTSCAAGIRLHTGVGKGQEKLGLRGRRGLGVAPASAEDSPWASDKGIGFHAPGTPSPRAWAERPDIGGPWRPAAHLPRPPWRRPIIPGPALQVGDEPAGTGARGFALMGGTCRGGGRGGQGSGVRTP